MKKINLTKIKISTLFFLFQLLSSCEVVEGIFKAGMGVGIFLVILVAILIVYVLNRWSKNK